jgi:hypothetical protein
MLGWVLNLGFAGGSAFAVLPLSILSMDIGHPLSKSISWSGNTLPISISAVTPVGAPPGNKGVVFKVVGGVVTIYVWDGAAWRS